MEESKKDRRENGVNDLKDKMSRLIDINSIKSKMENLESQAVKAEKERLEEKTKAKIAEEKPTAQKTETVSKKPEENATLKDKRLSELLKRTKAIEERVEKIK